MVGCWGTFQRQQLIQVWVPLMYLGCSCDCKVWAVGLNHNKSPMGLWGCNKGPRDCLYTYAQRAKEWNCSVSTGWSVSMGQSASMSVRQSMSASVRQGHKVRCVSWGVLCLSLFICMYRWYKYKDDGRCGHCSVSAIVKGATKIAKCMWMLDQSVALWGSESAIQG